MLHRSSVSLIVTLAVLVGCTDASESSPKDEGGQAGSAATGGQGGEPGASGGSDPGGSGGIGESGGTSGVLTISCKHPHGKYCFAYTGPTDLVSEHVEECSSMEFVTVVTCSTEGVAGVCDVSDGDLARRELDYVEDEEELAVLEEDCLERHGTWSDSL